VINIVIVGAGGFGREVLQYVRDTFELGVTHTVRGFIDDSAERVEPASLNQRILGTTSSYEPAEDDRFIIAVGDPARRMELAARLTARGVQFLSVIHPRAYIASSARLGTGCVVSPFATIGANAVLGDHVVLTYYSSVGHDARIGDCTALSPYSVTNGGTTLGAAVFLGSHATVNPLRRVGDGTKIAAGSIVYRNVSEHMLAMGNPAKARPLLRSSV
jgi:sugar O-acyltransferase (sialic acid O-acetyltransferase NeuD family)